MSEAHRVYEDQLTLVDAEVNTDTSETPYMVERIAFETAEMDDGNTVTAKPKIPEEETVTVEGVEMRDVTTRQGTVKEVRDEFPTLWEIVQAVQDGETVVVKADIHHWDQSADDSVDGDESYWWFENVDEIHRQDKPSSEQQEEQA